jgi:hypothetical protein
MPTPLLKSSVASPRFFKGGVSQCKMPRADLLEPAAVPQQKMVCITHQDVTRFLMKYF